MIGNMMTSPSAMEPMMPDPLEPFVERAVDLARHASALGSALHPITRQSIATLLQAMNSYYSNLIEGHHTLPRDIERALQSEFSSAPATRALQLEAKAHIAVQAALDAQLPFPARICTGDFLQGLHRSFYRAMPAAFLQMTDSDGTTHTIRAGALRDREVIVGRHRPPPAEHIPEFLARFATVYDPTQLSHTARIVAAAASHHRLAWIHPFLDGNGRVTRLFTDAYLRAANVAGNGLWVVSRGLARRRHDYLAALAAADLPRQGDLDGRGHLTHKGLHDFCGFFLDVCDDQIAFMTQLLELPRLEERILRYVERRVGEGVLRPEAGPLLRDVLLRGAMPRGEAARCTGLGERTARKLLGDLVRRALLVADAPKGPVRLGFPTDVLSSYFPRLYPEGFD